MAHHWVGVGCVLAACMLTTLGAWVLLGAAGFFIGAGLFVIVGALLVDWEAFNV